jgi:catechol 2,3-dioxygenase-like lactoylglutathione lyase family enzyme
MASVAIRVASSTTDGANTVIFSRDLAGMRDFYVTTMGFPVLRELGPRRIELRVGSCVLALTERGLMFDDPPPERGALSLQLAFRVAPSEVAACAELLRSRGVEIVGEPADQPWGHRTLFFRDPDGSVGEHPRERGRRVDALLHIRRQHAENVFVKLGVHSRRAVSEHIERWNAEAR